MEQFPERSQKVLNNRKWALNDFNNFCLRKGIMTTKPFKEIDMPQIGKRKKAWRPYSDTDLNKIFDLDWQPQERLLISMALATGCRLGEIACDLLRQSFSLLAKSQVKPVLLKLERLHQ
jgi:integrase